MAQDAINAVFQRYLGRTPTAQELQGFSGLFADKAIDAVGLAQFIQSSPEYLRAQAPGITRDFLSTQGQLDEEIAQPLLRKGFEQADSRLRSQGRPYSSALASAYARVSGDVYGQMAQQRSQAAQGLALPYYSAGATGPAASQGYDIYNRGLQRQWQGQDMERQIRGDELMRADNMRVAKMNQWAALGGAAIQAAGMAAGGGGKKPGAV